MNIITSMSVNIDMIANMNIGMDRNISTWLCIWHMSLYTNMTTYNVYVRSRHTVYAYAHAYANVYVHV